MSFLRINGYVVPVSSCDEKIIEVGSRSNGLDGTPLVDRLRTRRAWDCVTPPLPREIAMAVKALVFGRGDLWPFDADLYSGKGLAADSGVVSTLHTVAADGDPVSNTYKYTGSISVESATTNLLGADSRDAENAPTGFSLFAGGSISGDTSHYWQGTKSLKIVTVIGGGITDGAYTTPFDPGAGSAGKTFVGSVYLKGDAGSEGVSVGLYDLTNMEFGTTTDVVLSATTWTRVECAMTIGGVDCRSLALWVRTTSDLALTFYCDGFQIEERTVPTSWVDGSRAAGATLEYDPGFLAGSHDLTINAWIRMTADNAPSGASNNRALVWLRVGSTTGTGLYRGANANNLVFYTTDEVGGNIDSITETSLWDGSWKMVTAVIRTNPLTGVAAKELYVDGVSVGSSSPAAFTPPDNFTEVGVCNDGAGAWLADGAAIDDLMIVPFAANDAVVSEWYSMGKAMLALPHVYIDGDVIPDDEFTIEAVGAIGGITKTRGTYEGSWANNLEVIKFTLEEV